MGPDGSCAPASASGSGFSMDARTEESVDNTVVRCNPTEPIGSQAAGAGTREAFISHRWDGWGKEGGPLSPPPGLPQCPECLIILYHL